MSTMAAMTPSTWIFLRGAGRRFRAYQPIDGADYAAAGNLRLEIAAALNEGCSWQEIADAALLPVATVRIHGEVRQ